MVRLPIAPLAPGLLLIAAALFALATPGNAHAGKDILRKKSIGRSVDKRPIVVWRQGDARPGFRVLVVGSIHGDERQGIRVTARLRRALASRPGPKGVAFWTIRTANPDGTRAGTRRNARRVDLNRNFPYRWDGSLNGGYNSGPRPASEPETRAVMRLSNRVRFDLAIWYHQPWGRTLAPCNGDRRWAYLYGRLSGLRSGRCDRRHYPGSATSWQRQSSGTTAFVVEFKAGTRPRPEIRRHARAVIRLAKRMD